MFSFIAAEKANYPVSLMCRVLEVNRTSLHDWERRPPSDRALYDAFLLERIKAIHAASNGTYGAPRVHAELRLEHGIAVGRKRVERLMARAGLQGIPVPRNARTTVRVEGVRLAPDLVERDFNAPEPNRLWCADITYLPTWEGWLYLASVLDCFSRMIVGWCMLSHMRLELVERALEMAVARRRPGPGVIHHSDHGSQYTGCDLRPALRAARDRCIAGIGRRLLRQRGLRGVPLDAQARARSPPSVAHPRRAQDRRIRVHRGVLQHDKEALHTQLSLTRPLRVSLCHE